MRKFKGKATTNHEVLVAYLWEVADWVPTHELVKLSRPYGFVGSAGDVRARELARNECAEKLKDKVEREDGRNLRHLGLDSRFEYFRYKAQPRFDNAALLKWFDEYPCQCRAPEKCRGDHTLLTSNRK
jgi:hypothetical protein